MKKSNTTTIKQSVQSEESSTTASVDVGIAVQTTAGDEIATLFWELLGSNSGVASGASTGATSANVIGSGQIASFVSVAANELGYTEGTNNDTKYGIWYGVNNQPWCAMFVSWCANSAGVSDIVGKQALANGFMSVRGYSCQTESPHVGDLIIWTKNTSKHVGIIVDVVGSGSSWTKITTIEGNSGDSVKEKTYTRGTVNNRATAYFCTPPWVSAGSCKYNSSGSSNSDSTEKIT